MKTILNILLLVTTSNLYACPKLEGTYVNCQVSTNEIFDNPQTQIINEKTINGIRTYSISDALSNTIDVEIGNQNTTKEDLDEELNLITTFTSSCSDNELSVKVIDMHVERKEGSNISDEELQLTNDMFSIMSEGTEDIYSITPEGNLKIESTKSGMFENTTICTAI